VTRTHLSGLALTLAAAAVGATDYHVAMDGDDGNPGTLAEPWRTLQHAVESVTPGDRILVHAGTYLGARIEASGAPEQPITLQAAPGEAVLLDAPGPDNAHDSVLELETWKDPGIVAWWIVEGFEIAGSPKYGVDSRSVHHVTVRGNVVHGSALTGIFDGFADDVLYEGNESYANGEHGIYHSNSGDRPTVRGNWLHDNFAAGVHMNGDLSQGGDGLITEALIEANVIHGNGHGGGSGINLDGVSDSAVINNLIFDERASGISLYQDDGAECSSDNLVAHNTVLTTVDGRWALNMETPGCTGNRLYDNVFWTAHTFRGSISLWDDHPAGFVSENNALVDRFSVDGGKSVMNLAAWQALGYDAESFLATPEELFTDPEAGDFHLSPGSPAVDAGATLPEVPIDLEGSPRPQGAASDIGCYESGGAIFADGFESGTTAAWDQTVN
jgi:hypothetical protein